ncbi:MAG: LytTR family transcriptional regulator [Prevotella sp.]|nr:LytTR family transcriptional regulator [Prevotella sp.]
MIQSRKETFRVRVISVCFSVLVLAIFKPFGLHAWQWEAYVHLLAIGLLGIFVCMLTEVILKYLVRMPHSLDLGVDYIIRRNLWFQCINTFLVSLMICLYRHFVLSGRIENNRLSLGNFLETLIIMGFCSFAIGLYWRYKFRSRYLAAELEETRMMNEQLKKLQQEAEVQVDETTSTKSDSDPDFSTDSMAPPSTIVLTGSTSETVTLQISNLLYVEAVGNYVKVYQWCEGQVRSDLLRATSKQIEESLSAYPMIVRCHRAFLVNLGQVEKIVAQSGHMQLLIQHSHDLIPVSRSNMSHIKDTIKKVN